MSDPAQKKDVAVQTDLEDRLDRAAPWHANPESRQIVYAPTYNINHSPGTRFAQAGFDGTAVAGDDSQGAGGGSTVSKGSEDRGGGTLKWTVIAVALLAAVAVFGVLYLTDSIKLGEAGIGVTTVGVIAAILPLGK